MPWPRSQAPCHAEAALCLEKCAAELRITRQSLPGAEHHARAIAQRLARRSQEFSRIFAARQTGPTLAFVRADHCGSLMAVSAANIVSPTPAAGNPVANGASIAPAAVPTGGGFVDSLEAVLGISGVATGSPNGNADQTYAALFQNKTASLKSKLKLAAAESGAAVLNPQLAQQQTIISKLQDTASGIDIPALRAAMAKNAAAPGQTSSTPA